MIQICPCEGLCLTRFSKTTGNYSIVSFDLVIERRIILIFLAGCFSDSQGWAC